MHADPNDAVDVFVDTKCQKALEMHRVGLLTFCAVRFWSRWGGVGRAREGGGVGSGTGAGCIAPAGRPTTIPAWGMRAGGVGPVRLGNARGWLGWEPRRSGAVSPSSSARDGGDGGIRVKGRRNQHGGPCVSPTPSANSHRHCQRRAGFSAHILNTLLSFRAPLPPLRARYTTCPEPYAEQGYPPPPPLCTDSSPTVFLFTEPVSSALGSCSLARSFPYIPLPPCLPPSLLAAHSRYV